MNDDTDGHSILCIGLDIAWFGGSVNDEWSQYDCIASVLVDGTEHNALFLERVSLRDHNRDPQGERTLAKVDQIIEWHMKKARRVVFAVDAPIQACARPHLPSRPAFQKKGSKGAIERRCCEEWLSRCRKNIDRDAGGSNGWHPNIQAGAPLAPRVESLLEGLQSRGFALWTPQHRDREKLVIECFPAEAIWAIRRQGAYPPGMLATSVKAYKKQKCACLNIEQVGELVHNALDAFARPSGNADLWRRLVDQCMCWLRTDEDWKWGECYRGGKMLDDVVDTMICLATSLSYAHGTAHLWQDCKAIEDGHIIGPGCPPHGPWVAATRRDSADDRNQC